MEFGIIVVILLTFVNILSYINCDRRQEIMTNNIEDMKEKESKDEQNLGSYSASKMGPMILHSDTNESIDLAINDKEKDTADKINRKILKFSKRVIESIEKNGILDEDALLLKTGKYRIDWWKEDRRLERIRKRLSDELSRRPELKDHLRAMGWQNSSQKLSHGNKIDSGNTIVKKPINRPSNRLKNTLFYKTMMIGIESLLNFDTTKSSEKGAANDPTLFVYMKITVSSNNNNDRNKETASNEIPDLSTKFNSNIFDQQDFGVDDAKEQEQSNNDESSKIAINSSGRKYETDCLFKLIPLIVDELRNDRIDENEKRALSRIFGKRLWQLLEREATKKSYETMDKDLAMFLVRGELVERDPEMAIRRRRRLRRRARKIVRSNVDSKSDTKNNGDFDYNIENSNENFADKSTLTKSEWSTQKFDRDDEKSNDPSAHELLDFVAKYETLKLAKILREKEEERKKKSHYWTRKSEDSSDENYDY